ncbi:MAG: TfpX/TfpZ family type IV pilin accessory protein [Dokdonella sp.]
MSRWIAAGIHLSISMTIGLLVLALLFLVWYPQPYFDASGGQQLVMLLLGVDLVLGPLLTLILFKSGKKGMLIDLWMIGVLQFSALVYGLHVIAQARPVFIVAAVDRFNVVAANELEPADLEKGSAPQFRSMSWLGPRLVAARSPTDPEKSNALLDSGLAGKDIEKFPEYYVPYDEEAKSILEHAKSIASLKQSLPQGAPVIDAWLKDHQRSETSVAYLPIVARRASLTMFLDAETGAVLDAVELEPW